MQKLLSTKPDFSVTLLRVALGGVMFPHGAQKMLGWFGGGGFTGTMQAFTEGMGIPYVFALLAIIAEFFGAIALVSGFLTRIAAFGIGCVMVVAALLDGNGFFMNWFGQKTGEGVEYHLLAIAISVALMIRGGGLWSVDARLVGERA